MGEDLSPQQPGIPYPVSMAEYDEKVGGSVAEGLKLYDSQVKAQVGALTDQLGGNLDSVREVSVWDALRQKKLAPTPHHEAQVKLQSYSESWADKTLGEGADVMDEVFIAVAHDMMDTSTSGAPKPGPDNEQFSVGNQLVELLQGNQLADPVVLSKATAAIHLLGQYGLYKLTAKQNPEQLLEAVKLMEDFARINPDFNPAEAGLIPLVSTVVLSRAILQVDDSSKPQLKEDPASTVGSLLDATEKILDHLARAHTYAALPDHPNRQSGTIE
jgi:hypothetical protein